MRTRSLSILATTTALAALLGCPIEGLKTPEGARIAAESGGNAAFEDSAGHDDAVDSAEDVSWADEQLPEGRSALRVLMTDAPIEADNVFVTFCGIFVQASGVAVDARDPATSTLPREEGGAGGASDGRDIGAAGAPAAPPQGGSGGDGAGGAPSPESDSDDKREAERAEAERAEAERTEAERTEAERTEGDSASDPERDAAERERDAAERDAADGQGAGGQSGADPVAPRGDSGEGWQAISQECQTLDLLTLRDGVTEAVGVATLPPGHYGQIRLLLVDASIVVGGVEHELSVPSGMESGLKINAGFQLLDGAATTVTLDFDAGQSVHYSEGSGYRLAPVINVIDVISHDDGASEAPRDAAPPGVAPSGERPRDTGAGGSGGDGRGGGGSVPPPPPRVDPAAGDPPPPVQPEAPKAGDEPPPAHEPPPAEEPPPAHEPPPAEEEPKAEG